MFGFFFFLNQEKKKKEKEREFCIFLAVVVLSPAEPHNQMQKTLHGFNKVQKRCSTIKLEGKKALWKNIIEESNNRSSFYRVITELVHD